MSVRLGYTAVVNFTMPCRKYVTEARLLFQVFNVLNAPSYMCICMYMYISNDYVIKPILFSPIWICRFDHAPGWAASPAEYCYRRIDV